MRLILDEHLSPRRVGGPLRERGHDVLALAEGTERKSLPDKEVLELAARETRILVTCEGPDFTVLARAWAEEELAHAGIVVIWSLANHAHGPIVARVQALLDQRPEHEDWRNIVLGV